MITTITPMQPNTSEHIMKRVLIQNFAQEGECFIPKWGLLYSDNADMTE
jgi:hypothetical protein